MAKRVKVAVNVPQVNTLEEADAILAQLAAHKRSVALINAGLNEGIDGLKIKAAAECTPLEEEMERLEQALALFGERHKDTFFSKERSRVLRFGTIGFRASTKVALLNRQWSWERVLKTLKEKTFHGCIRVKEEVDKDALRALKPQELETVGVKLKQDDGFYYELQEAAPL